MKKKFLMIVACIGFCTAINAQTTPPIPTQDMENPNIATPGNSVGGANAPIAPATLLLLGLGASVAGVKVYRNQKQKED